MTIFDLFLPQKKIHVEHRAIKHAGGAVFHFLIKTEQTQKTLWNQKMR